MTGGASLNGAGPHPRGALRAQEHAELLKGPAPAICMPCLTDPKNVRLVRRQRDVYSDPARVVEKRRADLRKHAAIEQRYELFAVPRGLHDDVTRVFA